MATPTTDAPPHAPYSATARRVTGWDRAAITTLGAAGCALSYDALQQMAVAIHVRGLLTFLFPLVIDGFIAYGVRALLVLRTAPFRARLYVWALFGTATTASIWANALHAIRLNQTSPPDGLHLGDATVGILSTLAPLALAGAVHLHILIARETAPPSAPTTDETSSRLRLDESTAEATRPDPIPNDPRNAPQTEPAPRRVGRPPSADLEDLLALTRPRFLLHEKPTRAAVRQAIKDAGHSVSEDRLTQVMAALRTERRHHDASENGD